MDYEDEDDALLDDPEDGVVDRPRDAHRESSTSRISAGSAIVRRSESGSGSIQTSKFILSFSVVEEIKDI